MYSMSGSRNYEDISEERKVAVELLITARTTVFPFAGE